MPGRLQSPPDDDTAANVREYILATLEQRRAVAIAESEKAGKTPRQIQRAAWDEGSKDALARRVGMSPHQMSRRFRGWPFQVDELKRIAELWGVTTDEIMSGPSQAREEGG